MRERPLIVPGRPAADHPRPAASRIFARSVIALVIAVLLYGAFRNAPLPEIWLALRGLTVPQILLVLFLDALTHAFISLRWWIIIAAEDPSIRFVPIVRARLAAFGISYFTLGPQVGGEPFQVLYLRRQQGTSYARAAATVVLDKLLELLANFLFLVFGLAALISGGILGRSPGLLILTIPALVAMAAWPIVHLALLWNGRLPLTAALGLVPALPQEGRVSRYVRAAERLAAQFCRRHPVALLRAIGVSLVPGAAAVIEYVLITSFLGTGLRPWQAVAGWSAGWLSFLMPLPGGLGALEASQVLVLGHFGVTAAKAIGVTLVLRARDLLFGGLGLIFAAHLFGTAQSKGRGRDVLVLIEDRSDKSAAVHEPSAPSKETHD